MVDKAKLFYLVGASGSGKDSILKEFKEKKLQFELPVVIAHRYIDRLPTVENQQFENFISLSAEDFSLRKKYGLFAMDWQANGCCYGIGEEVDQWLEKGLSVIVNGSRAYLQDAQQRFKNQMISVAVDVDESVLEQRLNIRQRETTDEIQKRLQRHRQLRDQYATDAVIDNNGTLSESVDQFVRLINQY
jgi:ribose 1,5-bisphosphokinase